MSKKPRTRVTKGEVQMMLDEQAQRFVAMLEQYRQEAILPVLEMAIKRAAAYVPWYVRLGTWFRMRVLRRKS